MAWVAAAVVTTGAINAYGANKAAEAGADASDAAGARIERAAAEARTDVNRLFPQAKRDLVSGASAGFDLFNQGLGGQVGAIGAGNLNAQETLGQGFTQTRNAILGRPADYSFMAPKGQNVLDVVQESPFINPYNPITTTQGGRGGVTVTTPGLLHTDTQADLTEAVLSGSPTSGDIITAINRGELDVQGVDMDWFNKVMQGDSKFRSGNQLITLANMNPAEFDRYMRRSNLNTENKNNKIALVSEIKRLRGY